MKRVLTLLLALAMLMAMAVGCGSNNPVESSPASDVSDVSGEQNDSTTPTADGVGDTGDSTTAGEGDSTTTTVGGGSSDATSSNGGGTVSLNTTVTAAPSDAANVNATGFPIAKKTITLDFMVLKSAYHGDYAKMAFSTDYEKKTNIKINWLVVSDNEIYSKKQLTLASRDYPDAMFLGEAINSTDIVKYGTAGVLQSIDHLLPTYAPNLYKLMNEKKDVKKAVTAPDGKIYSLPNVSSVYTADLFTHKVYINVDWLNALNLEKPTNYTELLNVLRAFKKNDPNKNGRQDEIPAVIDQFSPGLVGSPQGLHWNWLNECMGVDRNGKVKYAFGCDEFRESLRFLRTLADEKLMDERAFKAETSVGAIVNTSLDNVGFFITQHGSLVLPESKINKFEVCQPIQGDTGKAITPTNYRGMTQPFWGVIPVTNTNVEATLRWLDYFYSLEGFNYKEYGPVGQAYKKMPSGKYQVILKNSQEKFKYAPGWVLPGHQTQAWYDSFTAKATTTVSEQWYQKVDVNQCLPLYQKYMPDNYIPALYFTLAESNKMASLFDGVHQYAKVTATQFVYRTGELNLDTGWNTYISELKKLGMDEIVGFYQKAYDKQK